MGGGSGPAHSAEYAPSFAPSAPPQQQVANGAIYQASYGYAPLTSGARASMVGDILTIALVERTQASKSNSATTDRAGKIGLSPPATGPLSLFSSSDVNRSEEHTSELQSLMRISYAVFCLKKKKKTQTHLSEHTHNTHNY